MSARLIADLETADAVVRAIDGVPGFEVRSLTVLGHGAMYVHLAGGRDRVPTLASILGEIYRVDNLGTTSSWDFVWRGALVSVFGDTHPASLAGAA